MAEFRYALVRYVPDALRMEPINIGIVLQGKNRLCLKLNTRASSLKEIDTHVFRHWRWFLEEEINGEAMPLFQPRKSSVEFFKYLGGLCEGPVLLSPPLYHAVAAESTFEAVLERLYERLVAPKPSVSVGDGSRPSGRFRQLSEEFNFLKRGMTRHRHVQAGSSKLWMAYRQVDNGERIAIDKVEVANQIGSTANEIERLPTIRDALPQFRARSTDKVARFVLLADQLSQPFTGQPQEEFEAMREDLEREIRALTACGAEVIRSVDQVEAFGREIDEKLPQAVATTPLDEDAT